MRYIIFTKKLREICFITVGYNEEEREDLFMTPVVENIIYNIVASIIYDVCKSGLGKNIYNKTINSKEKVEEYVKLKLDTRYEMLCNSGVLEGFLRSPLIIDILSNYILYVVTGKVEDKLGNNGLTKKSRSKYLEEDDLLKFLADKLQSRYEDNKAICVPEYSLLIAFFKEIFTLGSDYFFDQITQEQMAMVYFVNMKLNILGNGIFSKMDEIVHILNKSIQTEIVYLDEKLLSDKEYYTTILKENQKLAHIYMLDRFNFNEFYVPPFLTRREENIHGINVRYMRKPYIYREGITDGEEFEDWKYIFDRNNIVYVTGGAGYGKTLFMKKLIGEYEKLNIVDASEYMVIYGELKNFYVNNTGEPIPVIDFLQNSMRKETLIDDVRVSRELIDYYLRRGRCIILLDALDEVDKEKRQSLHCLVINYFKNQNPNNKICITSRARGFLPEKDIEVFEIEPLEAVQIKTYVDNIINLGKFDEGDKDAFLKQTAILVEKGFLNSFLVLSLLINIYKAERELPENKLELYQKCFEYISNKREKEKSQEKYDWPLITTLMKENTFMELANLCLPNNSDVNKEVIKERLTQIYKTKYVSENQTEAAIEQFLIFCFDRTELFVPASGEDCFKFFHRSFFEYFYSQYIFTRIAKIEDIYEVWGRFDVDSEIFELTLAMFKQKNESKYQEIVEFLLDKIKVSFLDIQERINTLNMLILCMQVVDDELYKKRFVEFLVEEHEFCKKYIDKISNQSIIVDIVKANEDSKVIVSKAYQDVVIYETAKAFTKILPDVQRYFKRKGKDKGISGEEKMLRYQFAHLSMLNFYAQVFFIDNRITSVIENLSSVEIGKYGRIAKASNKEVNKVQSRYKKFLALDIDIRNQIIDVILCKI